MYAVAMYGEICYEKELKTVSVVCHLCGCELDACAPSRTLDLFWISFAKIWFLFSICFY